MNTPESELVEIYYIFVLFCFFLVLFSCSYIPNVQIWYFIMVLMTMCLDLNENFCSEDHKNKTFGRVIGQQIREIFIPPLKKLFIKLFVKTCLKSFSYFCCIQCLQDTVYSDKYVTLSIQRSSRIALLCEIEQIWYCKCTRQPSYLLNKE